jgi:hypothetical protein
MKYEKEAKELFRGVFFDIDEDDWGEFESEVFKATGLSYEKLSDDIETGVNNGYSVEFQIKLLKDLLNSLK